jgi:outer membrane biogenesis lipoprotein LolB
MPKIIALPALVCFVVLMVSCSSSRELNAPEEMEPSDKSAETIVQRLPDYRDSLSTLEGSGRAIVSEPDNSERVTVQFRSNREESRLSIKNSMGIEGGEIYVAHDSLLVYNKVDKFAEKVSVNEGKQTSVGSMASMNILDLFNFTVDVTEVEGVYEDADTFVLFLRDGSYVRIKKESSLVEEVVRRGAEGASIGRIEYEGYANLDGFMMPRRITVYSSDGTSRAVLIVQSLEINTELSDLALTIPEDIPIYR